MSILPTLNSLAQPPVDCRWLNALRAMTVLYSTAMLVALVLLLRPLREVMPGLALAMLAPAALLYVLWSLRGNPPGKSGLALATAFGLIPGVPIALGALFLTWDFVAVVFPRLVVRDALVASGPPLQLFVLIVVSVVFIQRARKRSFVSWLWVLRILAAGSILVAALALHTSIQMFLRFGVLDWRVIVLLAGVALAYAAVIWGLGRGSEGHQTRQALIAAGVISVVVIALSVGGQALWVLGSVVDSEVREPTLFMLISWGLTALFSTYATLSIRTYYLLKREPGDRLRLIGGFAGVLLAAFCLAEVAAENVQQQRHVFASQSSAIGSLRTINTAEVTYASTYNHGYSSSLAALGPGTEGAAAQRVRRGFDR